jgi:hypothetical protein
MYRQMLSELLTFGDDARPPIDDCAEDVECKKFYVFCLRRIHLLSLTTNRKFERIVMQCFTTVRFDDYRRPELQARFEILCYWVGLDDVDHVFFQRPSL